MHPSMGVTVRYRHDRGWTVRVTDQGRRWERSRPRPGERPFGHGPEGEVAAREFARAIEEEQIAASSWKKRPGTVALGPLLEAWLAAHGSLRSERTQLTDRGRVARLVAFLGTTDARTLTEADCRSFAASVLSEGRSPALARGCLSTLRRVLNLAARQGILERNPVPEIATVMKDAEAHGAQEIRRPDAWTRTEVEALLELARTHEPALHPVLVFAFHTGARRGEILALRWEDVDFERSRVHVRRTARLGSRGTRVPKARRDRFTPLSPTCLAMLRGQRRPARLVSETRRRTVRRSAEWVFPSPRGKLWNEHNLERAWLRLRERARKQGVRPLPLHSTRHTFVTWALEAGTPAKRVAEWVGASVAVLEAHYAHVLPRTSDELGFLERVPAPSGDGVGTDGDAERGSR